MFSCLCWCTDKDIFPKIAGMNDDSKIRKYMYQNDLAKCDIVILGFYRGWRMVEQVPKDVVRPLRLRTLVFW